MSNLILWQLIIYDIVNDKITFLQNSYQLDQRYNIRILGSSINVFAKLMSTENKSDLLRIIRIMYEKYAHSPQPNRSGLLFITDIKFSLEEGTTSISLNFTPLAEDNRGQLSSLLCSVSLSTGMFLRGLYALDSVSNKRQFFDLNKGYWSTISYQELTPPELSVMLLSAQGLSVKETAETLHISLEGIRSIRKRILRKLDVKGITQAILRAINLKML